MSDHAHAPTPARGLARLVVGNRAAPARRTVTRLLGGLTALLACLACVPASALAFDHSFIGRFNTFSTISTTVPEHIGDENPYGIVTVPTSTGSLVRGDLLISNFNDEENLQGTGTTLVQITPGGALSLFAQIDAKTLPGECPGGVGLTTALAVLPHGYVVVGSLPTENGMSESAKAGCLIVLDSKGEVVETIAGAPINGPWDLTSVSNGDAATLFVSNVLNGTVEAKGGVVNEGTVVRIRLSTSAHHPPKVLSEKVIATGFPERTDPEALVVGPTGVGLGEEGALYVADTAGNRIAAVPNALFRSMPIGGGGITIAKGGFINSPLGLTIAPNDDILSANAGDGNIVETTPFGAEFQPAETGAGAGGLFGLTVAVGRPAGVYFVNDAENTLELLH
jgi:hypothetical protein